MENSGAAPLGGSDFLTSAPDFDGPELTRSRDRSPTVELDPPADAGQAEGGEPE